MSWRHAASLTLTLLFSACASLKPEPPPQVDEQGLRLSGRLSVQVQGRGGDSAIFELLGSPADGRLELSTPLGSLVARARWNPSEVLLQTPGEERRYQDLDELTREMLGESVPVAALFDWLRGRPWPAAPSEPLPQPARGFAQLGWQIDLSRFDEGLLLARRDAEPLVQLRARLTP